MRRILPSSRSWHKPIVALALLLVLAWFAPVIVARTPLLGWLVGRATADIQGSVRVGSASLGWLQPVALYDVQVADSAGRPVLTAPSVTGSRTLLGLVTDTSDLGTFRLEQPVLRVTCTSGQTNLETLFAPKPSSSAPSDSGAGRTGVGLELVNARVEVCDADTSKEWKLADLNLSATLPRDGSAPVTLKVQGGAPDTGTVDVDLSAQLPATGDLAQSVGQVKINVDGLSLALLTPLLRRVDPTLQLDGRGTLHLDGRWETDSSGTPLVRANGRVAARQLAVAAGFLADRPQLERLDVPYRLALRGRRLQVEKLELDCDVGKAWFIGTLDAGDDLAALARAGQEAGADVDLARLTALLPHTLHMQSDVRLTSGRLTARVQSAARGDQAVWTADLRTTELRGVNAGKPVAWPEPVVVAVKAQRKGTELPVLDQLRLESSFLKVNAAGSASNLNVTADTDLGDLATRLAQFIDLGAVRLAGRGSATVQVQPGADNAFTVRGNVRLRNFVVSGLTRQPWQEDDIDLNLDGSGTATPAGLQRLNAASLRAGFGPDRASVQLLDPIQDVSKPTATVQVTVRGDLARWQRRAQPFIEALQPWSLEGSLDASAWVRYAVDGIEWNQLRVLAGNLRVRGNGLDVREPTVDLNGAGRWQAGSLELSGRLTSEALNAQTTRFQVLPKLAGAIALQGDLARLRQMAGIPAEPLAGRFGAKVQVNAAGNRIGADVDVTVEQFVYGPPQTPVWSEASLRVLGKGQYDAGADTVRLEQMTVQSSAYQVAAAGALTQLSGIRQVAVNGRIDYDLEKLRPQLRAYLGDGIQLTGRDSRTFHIEGSLVGTQPVGVAIGQPAPFPLRSWTGETGLAWQSVQAFGCQVGPAEAKLRLQDGWVRAAPVAATFNGGRMQAEPMLRLAPEPMELHVAKGANVHHMKLTPALCAGYMGYALPALANATQAEGELSVALDGCRLPATGLAQADVSGRLTVHQARVSATSPLVRELSVLLLKGPPELSIARESVVPVRLVNGRVYHQNLPLVFPDLTVRTSGSVGLDGTLDLVAEFPVPPKWLAGRAGSALANQIVRVPVRGTLGQPKIDEHALRSENAKIVRDAAGNVLRQEAEKRLNRLLGPKN